MKKLLLFFFSIIIVSSCGVKKTQNLLSEGDYDAAINRAVEGLRSNKDSKGKQDYVYLLEEAFAKAKERDLLKLDLMIKGNHPRDYEPIYTTFLQLNTRQETIRPLLPLPLLNRNRNAIFPFENYNDQIIGSRNKLSQYLYDNSKALMLTNDKKIFRRAFDDLSYLNQINPNYKDVLKLMDEAQFKGTDFISVQLNNQTNMVIPRNLQDDLLDFSTYGLNTNWTVYHSARQSNIKYDYAVALNFQTINISPERVNERNFFNERQIKIGLKNLLDKKGNIVKDSLGKAIQVDNFKTVSARVYESQQHKACQVIANVVFTNLQNNQVIQSFPLNSESVFDNIYATFRGDRRAIDLEYNDYFDRRPIPFPSNEQMVFDTGEDLKNKLKVILKNNRL
ncbi:hypothetical protein [Flavobacterium sp. 14A]|uniref:hypothetical protein n=1 Tax=Flavobacterium sp. 14A TaxID=2735896 RepID=UPI001570570D|nr:hypothetical protein [Flavobacterium sp. 14A]NRT10421.1 hypothetical protein [Flavobacterium sp. 14A]